MIYCDNEDVAKVRLEQGFDSVTINMDVMLYIKALNKCAAAIKGNE